MYTIILFKDGAEVLLPDDTLSFVSGDTYSLPYNTVVQCLITSGGGSLYCTFVLPKLADGLTVTLTSLQAECRANGYFTGTGSGTINLLSVGSPGTQYVKGNIFNIFITKNSGTWHTNNYSGTLLIKDCDLSFS